LLQTIRARHAGTFRYQDNENYPEFIVDDEVLNQFNEFFRPCNLRLIELLNEEMPELMLFEAFDIRQWDFD